MPSYAVPEGIVFVEALRKTSVGKLDEKGFLEGAQNGESRDNISLLSNDPHNRLDLQKVP
jgi:hypothetical protein